MFDSDVLQLEEHLKEWGGEELEEDIKDELDAALQVVMMVMVMVMVIVMVIVMIVMVMVMVIEIVMVMVMQDFHSRNIKKGIEVRYYCTQDSLQQRRLFCC
jgi:hypothetical protein